MRRSLFPFTRSRQIFFISLLSCMTWFVSKTEAQVYQLSVTPMGTYDSRWDGASFGAVGSNGYVRDVNGAPVLTTVWESSFDTIWSQAGVDIFFETQQNLDLNDYTGSATNPINVLNFQNTAQENIYFNFSASNPDLESDLAGFTSSTGSANTHYVLFTNSYSNAPPRNLNSPPNPPLNGGLSNFSASGTAVLPSPGTVAPMRTIMATGDGVTAANEALFNDPSGLPIVLAHELGHNGSIPHINNTTSSEHYDPTRTESLMVSGGSGTGSSNVLTAGEVADALRTWDSNGTLALGAGQTGTFWDTNGAAAGYGGSGTWSGAASNWGRPSSAGVTGSWVGSEVAVFRASGSYDVTVSGTQTATGIAVQAGDPTFNGGTIDLSNNKGGTDVDGVPEIFVELGRTATINSVITGGGAEPLTKLGIGTLILAGNNTYTGGTQIRRGELRGNSASIRGNVALVNGANPFITTTLHFNQTTSGTFAGDITGVGDEVRKTGSGTLTLTSDNLSYTSVTNVNEGQLNINGTKSVNRDVTVFTGASLGGTGSIAGDTDVFGSLDLRDQGSGTLNFVDDLTFGSSATSWFEFDTDGTVDQVVVNSLLTIDGQVMFSDLGNTFAADDIYDILDWNIADFSSFSVAADLDPFLPVLGGGLFWDTSNFTSDGTLLVAIPEPGSAALLGLAACVICMGRRRLKHRVHGCDLP